VFSIVGRDPLIEVSIYFCSLMPIWFGIIVWILEFLTSLYNYLIIQVAVALEKVALSDEYFIKRKLYPNVDFYSGLIYR
jgi:hypothetical protein